MSQQRALKKSLAIYEQTQQVNERDEKGRKVCRWGEFKITAIEIVKKEKK